MTGEADLEDRLLWIVKACVIASGLALATGLLLYFAPPARNASTSLLAAGLMILMATPASRVLIATAERIRRGDWQFVVVTLLVLIELSVTMWYAATRI